MQRKAGALGRQGPTTRQHRHGRLDTMWVGLRCEGGRGDRGAKRGPFPLVDAFWPLCWRGAPLTCGRQPGALRFAMRAAGLTVCGPGGAGLGGRSRDVSPATPWRARGGGYKAQCGSRWGRRGGVHVRHAGSMCGRCAAARQSCTVGSTPVSLVLLSGGFCWRLGGGAAFIEARQGPGCRFLERPRACRHSCGFRGAPEALLRSSNTQAGPSSTLALPVCKHVGTHVHNMTGSGGRFI